MVEKFTFADSDRGQGLEFDFMKRDPIVQAWIDTYQKDAWRRHKDCRLCGWPHAAILCCGSGATFGEVSLGGHTYYIDRSNVDFMVKFVKELGNGFHWRNEVFFDVQKGNVIVSRVEPYNNTPHVKTWKIPLREWQSVVEFVERKR